MMEVDIFNIENKCIMICKIAKKKTASVESTLHNKRDL